MGFKAIARELGGTTLIDASGSFMLGARGTALRDVLYVLVSKGMLNLSEVHFIDSFGIGEPVSSYATVRKQGGELKLLHLTKKVRHVLQITRVDTLFEIHTDEQTTLRGFL